MHAVDHSKNIIELSGICFAYGGQEVLHEVDLAVHRGDYLGIVGPNGGGKTTLLKIMLGLLRPQSGSVRLYGQDLQDFKAWSKIGYVPQQATNFDRQFPVTVREVVQMGRYGRLGIRNQELGNRRSARSGDSEKVEAALAAVGMGEYADRLIGDLSGGQQQRVFIARALAGEPEVLILDEPTAGVDEAAQREFYALLKRLNEERDLTLILVSHDRHAVEREVTEVAEVNRTIQYEKKY